MIKGFIQQGWSRVPGQIPGKSLPLSATPRLSPDVQKLLTQMPEGVTVDRMLSKPVLRAQDAVSNLGLSKAMESSLSLVIQREAMKATNQVTFQKAINASVMEAGIPGDLQSLINSRAKQFYVSQLQKSGASETFTLAELSELKKSAIVHPPAAGALPKKSPEIEKEDNKRKKEVQKEMGVEAPKNESMAKGFYILEKSEGEGSRGGHVIGHTASGKAVYSRKQKENRIAGKLPKQNKMGTGAKRKIMLTGSAASSIGAEAYSTHTLSEMSDEHIDKLHDHLHKDLQKAKFEETGGKFVARVKKDDKVKYYYDEEKYKKEHGQHETGEQVRNRHIATSVHKATHAAGEQGCDVTHYKEMVQKFGAQPVHDAVKAHVKNGVLDFKKGRFFSKKDPEEKKEKKQ